MIAAGPFDITVTPQQLADADPTRGRMSMQKTYHGALNATASGEMLTGGDPKTGSAGYVAIERVTGTLDGRTGSFLLQHHATMHAGQHSLHVEIIPASGTDELTGITGKLDIQIAPGGKHSYNLHYELPAE